MAQDVSLLVDAKNALYMAIHAAGRYNNPLSIFLRQVNKAADLSHASSLHMFWDCPRQQIWRMKIHDKYKCNSKRTHDEEIVKKLSKYTSILKELIYYLGFRQYASDNCEADDLIYAYVSTNHPNMSVVYSSDSDIIQIPYRFGSARQLTMKHEFKQVPAIDPVILKCLVGDSSDNIPGYDGIGPVKGTKIATDRSSLAKFLSTNDKTIFYRNLKLIDLSLSDVAYQCKIVVSETLNRAPHFDVVEAQQVLTRNGIAIDLASMNIEKILSLIHISQQSA